MEYFNTDEWILNDANRPRDEFGFKLMPWRQMDKFDWRWTNKNIDFKQAIYAGLMVIPATWWVWDTLTFFKDEYDGSDLSFVDSFTPCYPDSNKHSVSWWQDQLKVQRRGDPWVLANNDWNLEFYKSGSYIIQAVCQFIFPNWYNTSTSYQVKEYVVFKLWDKEQNAFVQETKNQSRWCWTDDVVTVNHVSWYDAGDIINLWVSHTYSSNVMCRTALNVYRLS